MDENKIKNLIRDGIIDFHNEKEDRELKKEKAEKEKANKKAERELFWAIIQAIVVIGFIAWFYFKGTSLFI